MKIYYRIERNTEMLNCGCVVRLVGRSTIELKEAAAQAGRAGASEKIYYRIESDKALRIFVIGYP